MRKENYKIEDQPPELLEIIDAVNLIPFGIDLKTPKIRHVDLDENPQNFLEKLLNALCEFPLLINYLKAKTDENFEDYVGTEKEKMYAEYFSQHLQEFIKNRNFLKSLVEITDKYNRHLEESAIAHQKYDRHIKDIINIAGHHYLTDEWKQTLPMFSAVFPRFKLSSERGGLKWYEAMLSPGRKGLGGMFFESAIDFMELTVDEEHHIQIKQFGLLQLIQGCDLRRFKQCITCQKIIWAERLDRKFCSRKCSNSGWQRIYQSDEKKRKEYNERRRKTYNSKKEQRKAKIKSEKE